MTLRAYKKEDSAVICKWLRSEAELYKWSADRFNKYPLGDNDIDDNYVPQIETGRFIPLTAVDDSGKPVGHLIIRYPKENDDENVRFGFVVVDSEFRGRGYGKELLRLAVEYVKENTAAKRIDLGVFENNGNARRCYGSLGFKDFNRRKCEMPIGVWECIDMELIL